MAKKCYHKWTVWFVSKKIETRQCFVCLKIEVKDKC